MEKRISYFEFQSAKSIAKASASIVAKRDKAEAAIKKAQEEYEKWDQQIKAVEKGIQELTGFRVEQLVKKVVETGIDSKTGKQTKSTKYVPSDIVTFDESTRQYIINIPDENESDGSEGMEAIVPPTTEDGPGTDFDEDMKAVEQGDIDPLDMSIF